MQFYTELLAHTLSTSPHLQYTLSAIYLPKKKTENKQCKAKVKLLFFSSQ